jgi:hypothetical protein
LKSERDKLYDLLERRKIDEERNMQVIEELRLKLASASESVRIEDQERSRRILELEILLKRAEEEKKEKTRELDQIKHKYESSLHDLATRKPTFNTSANVRKVVY